MGETGEPQAHNSGYPMILDAPVLPTAWYKRSLGGADPFLQLRKLASGQANNPTHVLKPPHHAQNKNRACRGPRTARALCGRFDWM